MSYNIQYKLIQYRLIQYKLMQSSIPKASRMSCGINKKIHGKSESDARKMIPNIYHTILITLVLLIFYSIWNKKNIDIF